MAIKQRAAGPAMEGLRTNVRARQGANTPFPLKRSPPVSFKRLLDSAADDSLVEQLICSLVLVPSARKHRKAVLVLNELAPGAGDMPTVDLVTVSEPAG